MKFSVLDIVMGWSPFTIKEAVKAFPNTIISHYGSKTESFGRLDILTNCLTERCTYSNMNPRTYIYIDQAENQQDIINQLPSPTNHKEYVLYVEPALVEKLWQYTLSFHKQLEENGYLTCIRYPSDCKEESDLFENLMKQKTVYTTNGKHTDAMRIVRSMLCREYFKTL